MTVLNQAAAVRLGASPVNAVYAGWNKVWPPFGPSAIPGLAIWFDASGMAVAEGGGGITDQWMLDVTPPPATHGGDFTVGVSFSMASSGHVSHIRYWHPGAGGSPAPVVALWTAAGTNLGQAIDNSGLAPGWREIALPAPVPVDAGGSYVASVSTNGYLYAQADTGPVSISPNFIGPAACYASGSNQFPWSPFTANYFVDVVAQLPAPPPALTSLPNLANPSLPGVIVGAPAPLLRPNALHGLTVLRFKANEGRVRMTGIGVDRDYTALIVCRMVGQGRILTTTYPPLNLLIGYWGDFEDIMYAGDFTLPDVRKANAHNWKLYSADGASASYKPRLFSNGVFLTGDQPTGQNYPMTDGFGGRLNLSGYSDALDETCDCEIAEVCLYNRKLPDADRQTVEAYLRGKWLA